MTTYMTHTSKQCARVIVGVLWFVSNAQIHRYLGFPSLSEHTLCELARRTRERAS